MRHSRTFPYRSVFIALGLAGLLAACGPPPQTTGEGPQTRTNASASQSPDCAAMKRKQDAMVAQGQQNTPAYRTLLDDYLRRCFR